MDIIFPQKILGEDLLLSKLRSPLSDMSSSRLTLQLQERFKQNCNAFYSRPMIPKEELFDDSLTNLQWLQNLNVNIGCPVPPIPSGGVDSTRTNGACRRIRGSGGVPINSRLSKPKNSSNSPKDAICNNGERRNAKLQSNLLNGKSKGLKKQPLPPLIPQSRTPVPGQYRSRVGMPNRDPQKDSLPRLSGSNDSLKLNTKLCENAIMLNASPELALLSDATNNQYVLSPRQMDLDLFPGQVDYKNNPYIKPPYSHLALICMALRRSRSDKMTIQKICEWIKTNFSYYRVIGSDWQNSVRDNLARHKCFERVGRSAGKAAFWRIHPKYEEKLSEDVLRKRRLASAGEDKGQPSTVADKSSARTCSPAIEPVSDYDFLRPEDFDPDDDFLDNEKFTNAKKTSSAGSSSSNNGSAGQKRKQATPHRRPGNKKSKRVVNHPSHRAPNPNPLADQAPELGSLKGEFNFVNILEDLRVHGSLGGSSVNSSLSLPATPVLAPNRNRHLNPHQASNPGVSAPVTSSLASASESMLTDVMLPIDPSLMINRSSGGAIIPELCGENLPPELDAENRDILEEFLNADKLTRSSLESLGRRRGASLNTPTFELETNEEEISKSVEALDLTVRGNKIEKPAHWNPEDSLDLLLGEQVDHVTLDENDLGVGALDFLEHWGIQDGVADENSPRGSKKSGRRRPGSGSSNRASPRQYTPTNHLSLTPQLQNQLRNSSLSSSSGLWQEARFAADTIQSILGDDFE